MLMVVPRQRASRERREAATRHLYALPSVLPPQRKVRAPLRYARGHGLQRGGGECHATREMAEMKYVVLHRQFSHVASTSWKGQVPQRKYMLKRKRCCTAGRCLQQLCRCEKKGGGIMAAGCRTACGVRAGAGAEDECRYYGCEEYVARGCRRDSIR